MATSAVAAEAATVSRWTFGRVVRYSVGATTAVWLGKKMYDAGGNVHRFEFLVHQSLRKLPLYPPPIEPGMDAEALLRQVTELLPAEVVARFSEWFLAEDVRHKHGVLRQDVLDFIKEQTSLEIHEDVMKTFLSKGRGRGEEEQRLSECSLLGAFTFLKDVIRTNSVETVNKTRRKLSGDDDLDSIQLAVLEKEKSMLLAQAENLSEAEHARFDELKMKLAVKTENQ